MDLDCRVSQKSVKNHEIRGRKSRYHVKGCFHVTDVRKTRDFLPSLRVDAEY